MPLVDSERLAAFRLGFHVRVLRSILWTGIEGEIRKVQDVHGCLKTINDAAFVLADKLSSAEFANLEKALHKAGELHDLVCGIGPVEETLSERGALAKLEQDVLERIELLVKRVGMKKATLAAWLEVGTALAELRHKVAYVYKSVPIPPGDWEQLNSAVERLPPGDRRLASPFVFGMGYKNLNHLGLQLREAYDDICQCLSSPDRPQEEQRQPISELSIDVTSPSGSVVLRGQKIEPLVNGKPKPPLTSAQYDVIKFMIVTQLQEGKKLGVTKDDLEIASDHGDARKILDRVRVSDPDWEDVIRMAGKRGGLYQVR